MGFSDADFNGSQEASVAPLKKPCLKVVPFLPWEGVLMKEDLITGLAALTTTPQQTFSGSDGIS